MKKLILLSTLFLGACSSSQVAQINTTLNQYDQAILNFQTAANRVSSSIALTSQVLSGYCADAVASGNNLTKVVQNNSKALGTLNRVTAGLNSYCAAPPQDVGGAIVSLTAIIAAAKQAGG